MTARAWSIAALLVLTALVAGCTGDAEDPAPEAPRDDTRAAPQPPADGNAGGSKSGGGNVAAPRPTPLPVEDSGQIQGAFDKSWPVEVPAAGARQMTVQFGLSGIEPGAPPTARVTLRLLDPDGALVREATIGMGGDANAVEWAVPGSELPRAGAYTLTATAATPAGALPSAGLAKYSLYALVEY